MSKRAKVGRGAWEITKAVVGEVVEWFCSSALVRLIATILN